MALHIMEVWQNILRLSQGDRVKCFGGLFYLKPTMTTVEWFEEMAIPYEKIKLEIVERKISNAEWLLSSSRSDMKAMEQKNNIEISYIDSDNKNQLIRLEMLTGVSIYGQAGKCVEFMDVLRQKRHSGQIHKGNNPKYHTEAPGCTRADRKII